MLPPRPVDGSMLVGVNMASSNFNGSLQSSSVDADGDVDDKDNNKTDIFRIRKRVKLGTKDL